jgi:Uncharacterized protein conserved in bacteria (DUF2188)
MDKAAGRLGETAGRLTGDESLEAEARAAGKELARGHRLSQLLVHKKDGVEVEERRTYE